MPRKSSRRVKSVKKRTTHKKSKARRNKGRKSVYKRKSKKKSKTSKVMKGGVELPFDMTLKGLEAELIKETKEVELAKDKYKQEKPKSSLKPPVRQDLWHKMVTPKIDIVDKIQAQILIQSFYEEMIHLKLIIDNNKLKLCNTDLGVSNQIKTIFTENPEHLEIIIGVIEHLQKLDTKLEKKTLIQTLFNTFIKDKNNWCTYLPDYMWEHIRLT